MAAYVNVNLDENAFFQGVEIENSTATRRAWSDEGIFHDTPPVNGNATRRWSTTGDLQAPRTDIHKKRIKSVAFSDRIFVILIPNIAEYENAGISEQLWWHEDDYRVFKGEALEELKHFMQVNRVRDSKLAIQQLYFNVIQEVIPLKFNHEDSFQIPHGGLQPHHLQGFVLLTPQVVSDDDNDTSIDEKTTTASSSSETLPTTMDEQPPACTSFSSPIYDNYALRKADINMRQALVASVSPMLDRLVLPTMQSIDGLSRNPDTLQSNVMHSRFSALLCL